MGGLSQTAPMVGFSAKATDKPPPAGPWSPSVPCFTPICSLTPVIMPGLHELHQPERVFQIQRDEGLMQAHFILDEEEEVEDEKRSRWRLGGGAEEGDVSSPPPLPPAPWRRWLLLHSHFPRALGCLSLSPTAMAATLGANLKTMASIGKLKYQEAHVTEEDRALGPRCTTDEQE